MSRPSLSFDKTFFIFIFRQNLSSITSPPYPPPPRHKNPIYFLRSIIFQTKHPNWAFKTIICPRIFREVTLPCYRFFGPDKLSEERFLSYSLILYFNCQPLGRVPFVLCLWGGSSPKVNSRKDPFRTLQHCQEMQAWMKH